MEFSTLRSGPPATRTLGTQRTTTMTTTTEKNDDTNTCLGQRTQGSQMPCGAVTTSLI